MEKEMAGSHACRKTRSRAVADALKALGSREEGLSRWVPVVVMLFVVILLIAVVVLLQTGNVFRGGTSVAAGPAATSSMSSSTTLARTSTSESTAGSDVSTPAAGLLLHPIKNPARIVIPAIEVDAKIIKVGLRHDGSGSMEVPPYGLAAWFRNGPVPGEAGPTVIIGHVDSKSKPDVFNRLKDLKAGDEILVYDKSGDMATFVMDSNELIQKSELPTQRIWNGTTDPVIRLITCGGKWDATRGHYSSNLIVYGHLVK
jgi:LPXTG-site transpeptidase (sortase) family protein